MLGRSVGRSVLVAALAGLAILTIHGQAEAARVARNVWASQVFRKAVWLDPAYEYQFRTTECDNGVDPVMHIINASNVELAQNDDAVPGDYDSQITFRPPVAGTYYVVVRAFSLSAGYGKVQWRQRVYPGGTVTRRPASRSGRRVTTTAATTT